jgi:hypothetical protein
LSNTYQNKLLPAQHDPRPGEIAVPEQVIVSMAGIAGAAKEGLLALAVGTGLQVMTAMFDEDTARLEALFGEHRRAVFAQTLRLRRMGRGRRAGDLPAGVAALGTHDTRTRIGSRLADAGRAQHGDGPVPVGADAARRDDARRGQGGGAGLLRCAKLG